ncbi:pyridoxal phosphate-dependent transferase [Aspergillus fumigatus]
MTREDQREGKVVRLSSKTKELLEIDSKHSAGGIFPLPVFIKSGKDSILKDADGKEIIDFICMLSATNLGQCHPKLLQAMTSSMQTSKYRPHEPRRFTLEVPQFDPVGAFTLTNIATKVGDWAEFTRDMCARFGYDKMVGMVSGTEGADAAVKFARKWGIKRKSIPPRDVLVLGVSDNYHGVGSGIWPIMNDMGQASDYGIINENLRNTNPTTGELLKYGCLEDVEQVLAGNHGRVAAIIMECIHGKKRPWPILTTMGHLNKLTSRGASSFEEELNFAIGVRQLCKRYNILFIADEVRMGSGKTGKFLCSNWMGPENKPDMVVMGKSITGGAYPASYIFGNHEVMDLIGGYEPVATFGMAPAAIAATRATLEIIDEEKLVDRATWIGQVWKKETAGWSMPWLDYTTNRGADLGLYLKRTGNPRLTTRRLSMLCLHKGIFTYPDGDRVRMGVALNIPEADLLRGMAILKEALLELDDYDEIETGPPMKGVIPEM